MHDCHGDPSHNVPRDEARLVRPDCAQNGQANEKELPPFSTAPGRSERAPGTWGGGYQVNREVHTGQLNKRLHGNYNPMIIIITTAKFGLYQLPHFQHCRMHRLYIKTFLPQAL